MPWTPLRDSLSVLEPSLLCTGPVKTLVGCHPSPPLGTWPAASRAGLSHSIHDLLNMPSPLQPERSLRGQRLF